MKELSWFEAYMETKTVSFVNIHGEMVRLIIPVTPFTIRLSQDIKMEKTDDQ